MVKIKTKPSTIIRQNYNNFSKYCHKIDEPVVVTVNGKPDLVVMSYEVFQRMKGVGMEKAYIETNPTNPVKDNDDLFL